MFGLPERACLAFGIQNTVLCGQIMSGPPRTRFNGACRLPRLAGRTGARPAGRDPQLTGPAVSFRRSSKPTVAFRLRPQSGAHCLFIGPTAKGRSGRLHFVGVGALRADYSYADDEQHAFRKEETYGAPSPHMYFYDVLVLHFVPGLLAQSQRLNQLSTE
jgi:hypothetical protein